MQRKHYFDEINAHFRVHTICAILGPRQVGKTTLAHMYVEQYFPQAHLFDLENPVDLARLENPMLALERLTDTLIVIDEIQRRPELFPVLRVLADQKGKNRKFLILGSASRDLIRQSSETLAGRIGYIELMPLSLYEVKDTDKLWMRGGFPLSYLAHTDSDSYLWRKDYISSFLERDIPNLGFNIPAEEMRRFWLMLAHYHGQTFNANEIARSLALSNHMVRKYLDVLSGTFMVRVLYPWFENLQKRQVKAPKIYFRDSGILFGLIGITDENSLHTNPRLGAFWEGFALEEIIHTFNVRGEECYFWATQAAAEIDLFMFKNGKRLGFEFKYADAPKITKSMNTALQDLKLDHIAVIYPGSKIFPLADNITAFGLQTIPTGEFMKEFMRIVPGKYDFLRAADTV